MGSIQSRFRFIVIIFGSVFCAQSSFAKQVYKCTVNGVSTFQGTPCKDKRTQKVACVNYAVGVDFKDEATDECHDSGLNNGSGAYGGYNTYSSSSGSYSSGSSRSSYSSSRTKNQNVSGYTRKDGTYVQPYKRTSK